MMEHRWWILIGNEDKVWNGHLTRFWREWFVGGFYKTRLKSKQKLTLIHRALIPFQLANFWCWMINGVPMLVNLDGEQCEIQYTIQERQLTYFKSIWNDRIRNQVFGIEKIKYKSHFRSWECRNKEWIGTR